MWEAFQHASYYKLDNLIAILDMNRLGQTRETMDGWHGDHYAARAEAFGWHAIQIDGHDPEEIDRAYAEALEQADAPTLIIAKTKKGRGVSFLEDVDGMHGKPVAGGRGQAALDELGEHRRPAGRGAQARPWPGRELHRRPDQASWSCRPGRSGTKRRPAAPTARPSRRWVAPGKTSSPSTAR